MFDARHFVYCRGLPLLLGSLCVIGAANGAAGGSSAERFTVTEITKAVISSLPTLTGRSANVISTVDLTRPFETSTQWTFAAAILPGSHFDGADETPVDGGALAQCFVEGLTPHCSYGNLLNDFDRFRTPVELYSGRVVFAGENNTNPLLLIKSAGAHSGNGSHAIHTDLYTYDRPSNSFVALFTNVTGSNNNQETRFVADGPLRGDVVVAEPTSSAPFGFWVSVYVETPRDGHLRRTLRYRSATHYGDGNHLAVIDSEMPGILQRMGFWKTGDPLPAPPECTRPVLLRGELWCQ